MHDYQPTTRVICVLVYIFTLLAAACCAGYAEPNAPPATIEAFFQGMVGEWIGSTSQCTDGGCTDTTYFHSVTKQLGPDAYETVSEYFRIDTKTGDPVQAGSTTMTTKIAPDGTATNTLAGKGDILVGPDTRKPETHKFTETLVFTPAGGLNGTGGGSISVSGLPLGLGKNGKVTGYCSACTLNSDTLTMSQKFKVEFRVLLACKRYTVAINHTAKRGSDVMGLMKNVQSPTPES